MFMQHGLICHDKKMEIVMEKAGKQIYYDKSLWQNTIVIKLMFSKNNVIENPYNIKKLNSALIQPIIYTYYICIIKKSKRNVLN